MVKKALRVKKCLLTELKMPLKRESKYLLCLTKQFEYKWRGLRTVKKHVKKALHGELN